MTKRLLLLALLVAIFQAPGTWKDSVYEAGLLIRSVATFHLGRALSKWRYGDAFNYHQMAGDTIADATVSNNGITILMEAGKLKAINDGRHVPLILGSIPSSSEHIERLRAASGHRGAKIGIYTLNHSYERYLAGESALLDDTGIQLFEYPTTDHRPPSFMDLLRVVHALDRRDAADQAIAYVHCKAGKGRSAVVIAAYIAHLLHQAEVEATPSQIVAYLVSHRSQVHLNSEQMSGLAYFQRQLKQAGGLTTLYALHHDAIAKRDEALKKKK